MLSNRCRHCRREVAARRADIGREQGVADEDVAFDRVAQAVGGVAGRGHHREPQRAGLDRVAVVEGGVEGVAQRRVAGLHPEHAGEMRLHAADAVADAHGCAGRGAAQHLRGREVVGMRVGLQDPVHLKPFAAM